MHENLFHLMPEFFGVRLKFAPVSIASLSQLWYLLYLPGNELPPEIQDQDTDELIRLHSESNGEELLLSQGPLKEGLRET